MNRLYAVLICLCLAGPVMAQDAPGTITSTTSPVGVVTLDVWGNLYVGRSVYFLDLTRKEFVGGEPNPQKTTDFADGLSASANGWVSPIGLFTGLSSYVLGCPMVVDLNATIFIASPGDQRIRRIDPFGILGTVAGSGSRVFPFPGTLQGSSVTGGFSGDGGPATQAQLSKPADVALDAWGNLYIADCENGRIRLVSREGFITTLAGNGGLSTGPLGDGGPAILGMLYTPVSVAADLKGNVYVAEFAANRVRKIAPDDQHTITTFAGTGQEGFSGDGGPANQARLNSPAAVRVDVAGNVYIADYQNQRVRVVDTNGIITTFAGNGQLFSQGSGGDGGPATQAPIGYPFSVAVDAKGNVYISCTGSVANGRLRRVTSVKNLEIPSIKLASSSLSFVITGINSPVKQTFTISNVGQSTPLVVDVETDKYAPEWKVVSQAYFPVQPGGSQVVTVRYTPTSLTSTSSTLKVYHSGAEEKPLTVRLNAVPGTTKSADFDGDGRVGLDDFFLFAGMFGKTVTGDDAKYDLDGSGRVDFDDFFLFAGKFGR